MIYIPPQMQQMPSSNETTIRQNQNHQTIELSLPKTADYLIDSIDEISPDKAELSNIKFNQNDFNNESDHQTNSNSDDQEVQEIIEKDQSQILQQNTKQNPIQTSPEEINQSQAFADAAEQDENPKIEETQKNEVHENLAEKVSTDGKNEVYEESKEPKNNEIKEEVKKKKNDQENLAEGDFKETSPEDLASANDQKQFSQNQEAVHEADQNDSEFESAQNQKTDQKGPVDQDHSAIFNQDNQKPIHFILDQNVLKLSFRDDVNLKKSTIKLNRAIIQTYEQRLDPSIQNHISYELKNDEGIILESSEQIISMDDKTKEDYESAPIIRHHDLGISSSYQVPVSKNSSKDLKITVDGQVVEDPSTVVLHRSNKEMMVEYVDQWGIAHTDYVSIVPLAQVVSDIRNPSGMMIENDLMKIQLEGNWEGMALKMVSTESDDEVELPFESDCLQIRLNPGQSYQFMISHPLLKEEISWSLPGAQSGSGLGGVLENGGKEDSNLEDSSEMDQNTTQNNPDRQPEKPVQPEVSIKPDSSLNSSSNFVQEIQDQINPEFRQQEITIDESKNSYILSPELKELEFSFSINGIELTKDKDFQLTESARESVQIENGEISMVEYRNSLDQRVFKSLDEALQANSQGSIEASFLIRDLYGKKYLETYQLIAPVHLASGVFEMTDRNVMNTFAIDDQGKLSTEISEFVNTPAMICKGYSDISSQKVYQGDEIRLYLNVPGDEAQIFVDDRLIENPEIVEDELGLSYVRLQANEAMNVRVVSEKTGSKIESRIEPLMNPSPKANLTKNESGIISVIHLITAVFSGLFLEGRRRFG